ncbi:hypothetical protein N8I74_14980 [Chitiniphilus purpureus]|uniref:DUF3617 family protein n=1 Tax=Chitiniphilus purpureus TaxID=2981137 RepID=A0ABY6DK48_9NEIS|nr:hypothetical protein [Chitiniphilus sp. CD1]UXY14613.1 hypothetical protein N8I74_14980 [Chitiniphilus sp. CD1]
MTRYIMGALALLAGVASAQPVLPADFVGNYWAKLHHDRRARALLIDTLLTERAGAFTAHGRFGVICKGLVPVVIEGRRHKEGWQLSFSPSQKTRITLQGDAKHLSGSYQGEFGTGQLTVDRGEVAVSCPELFAGAASEAATRDDASRPAP